MARQALLKALSKEYPNGVSFDPMALRLLRQKIPMEDSQIENLKANMLQLGGSAWFSIEMISGDESLETFMEQAEEWLMEYGCFSIERLLEGSSKVLRHISTSEDCATFLRHLGYKVTLRNKYGFICLQPPSTLEELLVVTSQLIAERVEEADGILALGTIEEMLPHLTVSTIDIIRKQYLPVIHLMEVGRIPCWCSAETISLPEDFSDKVTISIDTLIELGEKVTAKKLGFVLNILYRKNLREEYALEDNDTFIRVCAKYYQGENDIFRSAKKSHTRASDLPRTGRRERRPNTTFSNLAVPIASELVFIRDNQISCTVLDDINKVEYEGRTWAISALANHLLNGSTVSGFAYFCYEGETLVERRSRFEREDKR